ncbi:MAG: amino-acid N-acetyltransferase [Spirochaetaceae bacterium]|nr:MAG: amino-acid N-acetyltransferase [Spirochaetaceae bacterium]
MESDRLQEQVELIRQVFEYVHLFKGKTIVIKVGGSVMDHPFLPMLVKDLVLLHRQGIRIILVPGAKERIDDVLRRYNIPWESIGGVRISTPEAIPFIKMAAFDVSNRLMTLLAENNASAIIGNWVRARSLGVLKGIDYQDTGTVEKINVELVRKALDDGLIPIFPNIGWSSSGKPYNISSNELAYILARNLKAEKLFYISRHTGVDAENYTLPEGVTVSSEGVVTHLSVAEADSFLRLNAKKGEEEILELIRLGCKACAEGVPRVHIVDGEIEGVILKEIFSSRGCGTMIYTNEHENIRPLRLADIPEVLRIMNPFVEEEILLPRDEQELADQLDYFVVYEVDGILHACGALIPFPEERGRGEIAAIAVDRTYTGFGIGKRILTYLVDRARSSGLRSLYVLTTQTTDWFLQFGFSEGELDDLPKDKRRDYNRLRNSRVLILDLKNFRSTP